MKKVVIGFCILLFLCTGISNAQIQVKPSGAIRMGVKPVVWSLQNGMEINFDTVKLHLNGGILQLTGKTMGVFSQTGPIGGFAPIRYTYLTGATLSLGTSENQIQNIYTHNITYDNSSTTSDRRAKENIQTISGAKEKVMRLNPVTYDLKAWTGYFGDSSELKNKAGFIAQEVLDVIPGAVGYNEEMDQYSLSYTHFIPYLTQVLQEQDVQIRELTERIAQLEEVVENLHSSSSTVFMRRGKNGENKGQCEAIEQVELQQNKPNPFSQSTTIEYTLPAKAKKATINLYSAQGKHIHTYFLPTNTSKGSVMIEAYTLTPGIYTYSLTVDGTILTSKKMVVTE